MHVIRVIRGSVPGNAAVVLIGQEVTLEREVGDDGRLPENAALWLGCAVTVRARSHWVPR